MFADLFLWFTILIYTNRPMCVPTPNGDPCPWQPWPTD